MWRIISLSFLFMLTAAADSKPGARGDWLIKGIQGEFYPCKPDIFAATYDPIAA